MRYLSLVLFFFLSACNLGSREQSLYEIGMLNGDSIYSHARPKIDSDGYYRFDDVNNQRYIINQNLVLFIEPVKVLK